MKSIVIDNKYANALLEFLKAEVMNGSKELEGIVGNSNKLTQENIYLYECFQALNKIYNIQEIENKMSLWFPYGILISAHDFSYEVVKKYTRYIAHKYHLNEKELFFNPSIFFQSGIKDIHLNEIIDFFTQYKNNQDCIKNIENKIKNNQQVILEIDEEKFLKTKIITNITEKNKDLLEFLLENEVFTGNSRINYAGKELCLLEYFLLRSLSCSKEIIKKMMLQVNKNNLTAIKNNILSIDLSYLKNFQEESENFKENMNLLERKMILLKFEEEERSSGSSSKGVVKI